MKNTEESNEFCLCDGEGMHIFMVCPKDTFESLLQQRDIVYFRYSTSNRGKKKLKRIM